MWARCYKTHAHLLCFNGLRATSPPARIPSDALLRTNMHALCGPLLQYIKRSSNTCLVRCLFAARFVRTTRFTREPTRRLHSSRSYVVTCKSSSPSRSACICKASSHRRLPRSNSCVPAFANIFRRQLREVLPCFQPPTRHRLAVDKSAHRPLDAVDLPLIVRIFVAHNCYMASWICRFFPEVIDWPKSPLGPLRAGIRPADAAQSVLDVGERLVQIVQKLAETKPTLAELGSKSVESTTHVDRQRVMQVPNSRCPRTRPTWAGSCPDCPIHLRQQRANSRQIGRTNSGQAWAGVDQISGDDRRS